MFILQQIIQELFVEKTRMILTILSISWATFTIAMMLSVGEGLRLNFAETLSNTGANLLTIKAGRVSEIYNGLPAYMKIYLTNDDFNSISALPNIQSISKQYSYNRNLSLREKRLPKQIQAVNSNYAAIHEIDIKQGGRFISPQDIKDKKAVIVLGTETFKDFFKPGQNAVGKNILIGNKPFLIVGVMKKKSQLMASEAPDANLNWIPSTTYELYSNAEYIDSIDITYDRSAGLDTLKQHIQQAIARNHHANPDDSNIVHFTDFSKRQAKINDFFFGMQMFLGIVGALTLLVAGVGIANVMLASVNRTTYEIGIRMAVGAKSYQILLQYIMEAVCATFIGGLIGIICSFGFIYALNMIPMQGKFFDVIGEPRPTLSPLVIVIVVIILGFTGLLAGLFPALKASKIDPAEALSYE